MKSKLHNAAVPGRMFPHAFFAQFHLLEAHLRTFLTASRLEDHPNEDTDELKRFPYYFCLKQKSVHIQAALRLLHIAISACKNLLFILKFPRIFHFSVHLQKTIAV